MALYPEYKLAVIGKLGAIGKGVGMGEVGGRGPGERRVREEK